MVGNPSLTGLRKVSPLSAHNPEVEDFKVSLQPVGLLGGGLGFGMAGNDSWADGGVKTATRTDGRSIDAACRTSFDNESRTTLGECDREGAWIHALIDNDRPASVE